MNIIDLNNAPYSRKHGLYGGNSGDKEGIIYDGKNWLLKYAGRTDGMTRVDVSYTTSPLSEYLGSHVFQILGYEAHNTLLGEKNNKIVVICEDFEKEGLKLMEVRTIKNTYNDQLTEIMGRSIDNTGSSHQVDLDNLLIHFDNNPMFIGMDGLKEFFWKQAIIDILIGNTDRNNGNWGLLRDEEGHCSFAPVFDNGGSFQNKLSEEKIQNLLSDREKLRNNLSGNMTVYAKNGHSLSAKKFLEEAVKYKEFQEALMTEVPNIQNKMDDILHLIDGMPTAHILNNGKETVICSPARKELFKFQMESRMNDMLMPLYEQIALKRNQGRNMEELDSLDENNSLDER